MGRASQFGMTRNLASVLEKQIQEVDSRSSEVGSQREKSHRMFNLSPLGNEQSGRSHYISADVLDVVKSKQAYFTEVFMSARQQVKFMPGENETQEQADAKTQYVERQLDKNHWYRLFRDGLHDAFVAKRCVYLIEWKEEYDTLILNADGADPMHIQWQIHNIPDVVEVDDSELQGDGPGGLFGNIRLTIDNSKVCIKLIQPERYYRDPHATYPEDSLFCAYEDDQTRASLIQEGYDPEQINTLGREYRFRREEEDNARKAHDGSWTRRRMYKREKDQEELTIFTTYTWLMLSNFLDGAPEDSRLYKVRWCDNEVLRKQDGSFDIEEVSEMPFLEWCQYKVSHAEYGLCDADVVSHTQKTSSTLKRLAIDNQQMRNSSRWEAVKGAINNPRDLLDTAIGGVVWVQQSGSVNPLPAPELSPMTGQVIELLEQDKEARTGSSRLSKGLNQDAISKQNAADMLERLTNNANRRIMAECRDYAEDFLGPLMKQIYRLGVRHDRRMYVIEAGGAQQQISPEQWQEPAPNCTVATALTPDEGVMHAQQLAMMHMQISQDPVAGSLYGLEQRHALYDEMFDAIGIPDASRFLMLPGSPEHQQVVQQQQMEQQQMMAMQQAQMEFQQQMMAGSLQNEMKKTQIEEARKIHLDGVNMMRDDTRAQEELEHQKVYDFQKLAIERRKASGG